MSEDGKLPRHVQLIFMHFSYIYYIHMGSQLSLESETKYLYLRLISYFHQQFIDFSLTGIIETSYKVKLFSFPYKCYTNPCFLFPSENYYTPDELALYREQREKSRIAQEKREAELNELRKQLADRRRQQQ